MQKQITLIILVLLLGVVSVVSGQSTTPSTSRNESEQRTPREQKEKEELARQYYRNQEYSKAITLLNEIYWDAPSHSNYIYYTYSLFGLQQFEEAEKVIKYQIKQQPNQVRYQIDLGYVYRNTNNVKKAERLFDRLIKDLTANENLIKRTAGAFRARRENEYALRTYQKGEELFDDPHKFAIEIGQLYDRMGKYDLMFEEYLGLLTAGNGNMQRVQYRIQNSLRDDRDNEKAEFFRNALLRKVQENPDTRLYSELLLWLSIQQRDFDMALRQTKALERRFNLEGKKIFELGSVAMNNKRYDIAKESFAYAIKTVPKSSPLYYRSLTESLKARFLDLTHKQQPPRESLLALEQDYHETLEEMGRNKLTYPLITNLARLKAYHLQKTREAKALLQDALEIGGIDEKSKAETKTELANILLFNKEPWEATLLYSQVEKAFPEEPVGHEAKYQNAMLSFYIGEFEWAKAKFDVLRSATSKLIANDAMEMAFLLQENLSNDSIHEAMKLYARANMLLYQNRDKEALQLFDTIAANHPTHSLRDNVLFKKAVIAQENFEFEKADSLYAKVYNDFGFDLLADNALIRGANICYEELKQPEKAMALYKKILTDYPGSIFVFEARKKYREIREKDGQSQEIPGSTLPD